MVAPHSFKSLEVIHTLAEMRQLIAAWRRKGERIALVPTMGALHDGHLSLLEIAKANADRVVASIFLNPTQFAANEDLSTYPRREQEDLERLSKAPCDAAYLPSTAAMYPEGFQTSVEVEHLSKSLCGHSRPHFFGGVATVVLKLLNQVQPDTAIFGEKDYQQLLVIRRLVRDLNIPVDIISAPIFRDADGLAKSSRNLRLTPAGRKAGLILPRTISSMAQELSKGAPSEMVLAKGRQEIEQQDGVQLDYLEICHNDDLSAVPSGPLRAPGRVFVAAITDDVRLIDNWPAEPPTN